MTRQQERAQQALVAMIKERRLYSARRYADADAGRPLEELPYAEMKARHELCSAIAWAAQEAEQARAKRQESAAGARPAAATQKRQATAKRITRAIIEDVKRWRAETPPRGWLWIRDRLSQPDPRHRRKRGRYGVRLIERIARGEFDSLAGISV